MSLSNSDMNRILKGYDKRQAQNTYLHKQRQLEVFENVPDLRQIHTRISAAGFEAIQKTMSNPSRKAIYDDALKKELSTLRKRRVALLEANGYPKDYLDPIYTCKDCKDTGYILNERCHCLKQAIIDFSYEQSNLKDILQQENFNSFSLDYYSKDLDPNVGMSPYDNMRSVYVACRQFVDQFEDSFDNLILYGKSGLGKTFLCNCIAKDLLDKGKTVIYLSSFQLFRLFENYRFHKDEEIVTNDDIESIFQCDLLIVDDLGTEFNNALTNAELFNCLNSRLLQHKATVISTNLHPNEWLKKYSERIVSRIFGYYTQLKFFGKDIRMQKYN